MIYFRGKFVRKGTFKVKRGRKAEENKENVNNTDVPVITVNREGNYTVSSSFSPQDISVAIISATASQSILFMLHQAPLDFFMFSDPLIFYLMFAKKNLYL